MDHIKAIALKFILTLALLYVILGAIYGMTFGNVFLITLVLGIASYILGDMIVLPRTNNTIATIADFGMAFLIVWSMSAALTTGDNLFTLSLITALAVSVFEYFYHKYVTNRVLRDGGSGGRTNQMQYQTEASEELNPIQKNNKNNRS